MTPLARERIVLLIVIAEVATVSGGGAYTLGVDLGYERGKAAGVASGQHDQQLRDEGYVNCHPKCKGAIHQQRWREGNDLGCRPDSDATGEERRP